jgi:hypothetical protein
MRHHAALLPAPARGLAAGRDAQKREAAQQRRFKKALGPGGLNRSMQQY